MKDIERRIISQIIFDGKLKNILNAGITPDFFIEPHDRSAFEYIMDYWQNYHTPPTRALLRTRFPHVDLIKNVQEPIEALIDQFKDRYTYNELSRHIKMGIDLLQKDTKQALDYLGTELTKIKGALTGLDNRWDIDTDMRRDKYLEMKKFGLLGVPCLWDKLNWAMGGGFQKEHLVFVVGRTGTGKTWWLTNNALHAWRQGFKVLFATREMTNYEIMRRTDGLALKIPYDLLVGGKLPQILEDQYFKFLKDLPTLTKGEFHVTTEGFTTASLTRKILEVQPDICFVDGAYLMEQKDGESKTEGIYRMTSELKRMAQKFKIPIVGSSQLKRGSWGGRGGEDRMAQIAWGDSFGQDSNVVVELIYSKEMAYKKCMWHLVAKNREGPGGFHFPTHWDFDMMNFDGFKEHEQPPVTMEDMKKVLQTEESNAVALQAMAAGSHGKTTRVS